MQVYLNGEFIPRERAVVSVDDRGFLFGDGVYEVSRGLDGRVVDHERHARRLARNIEALSLSAAGIDEDALQAISERLLAENGLGTGHATVYVQVTRGTAPRTHHYPDPAVVRSTVYVSASPFTPMDDARDSGVRVITVPDIRWGRCDIKAVNLLPNVMAKQEAVVAGAHEALFVRDGVVTEGAATSVFAVAGGAVLTHPLSTAVLPGVTREVVLELAHAARLPVREEPVGLDALLAADEVFLTSTTNDVMPVVAVDGRTIGAGRPGPVSRQLAEAFLGRVESAAAGSR
jgi:D-alanine transaminase